MNKDQQLIWEAYSKSGPKANTGILPNGTRGKAMFNLVWFEYSAELLAENQFWDLIERLDGNGRLDDIGVYTDAHGNYRDEDDELFTDDGTLKLYAEPGDVFEFNLASEDEDLEYVSYSLKPIGQDYGPGYDIEVMHKNIMMLFKFDKVSINLDRL